MPRSDGLSRISNPTSPIAHSATTATAHATDRQPSLVARCARNGRKINCPVALLAVSAPITSPRCLRNHDSVTVAPSTSDTIPLALPTSTPHSSIICHGALISVVSATHTASTSSAAQIVRRRPNLSVIAAANGPINPKSKILIAIDTLIVAADHPNSSSRGTMRMLGVARTPATTKSTTNVTAATTQA